MGRPKKIKVEIGSVNVDGIPREVDASGTIEVLGLFSPQDCDIREEIQGMEAYTEHCRERELED